MHHCPRPTHLERLRFVDSSELCLFPVLQDEKTAVDLAHSEFAPPDARRAGYQEVDLVPSGERPQLHDGLPQLHVRLVHLLRRPHLDAQVLPDQSEEGGGEVDLPLGVHRHVHPDQLLVRQPVRALAAEAEGRVHVLQHVVHLGVVDPPRGARVVLRPDPHELVQVVSPEDGGVPGQVVEVVHDDGHEQVEHQEAAEEDEGDEEGVGEVGAAGFTRVQDLLGDVVQSAK